MKKKTISRALNCRKATYIQELTEGSLNTPICPSTTFWKEFWEAEGIFRHCSE